MADDITLPGTGESVETDQDSTRHVQGVKTLYGAANTFKRYADGDQVDSAGYAGWVRPRPNEQYQAQDSASLTTSSTAYVTGDVLGAGWTFTSMATSSGKGGFITGARVLDDGDVLGAVDLWLFAQAVTFGTDNSAPSLSDADGAHCVGKIEMPAAYDLGGCRITDLSNIAVRYRCAVTSLVVHAVTLSDHSFFAATDDLHLELAYLLN